MMLCEPVTYGNTAFLMDGFSWGKPVGFLQKNGPELDQLPLWDWPNPFFG